MSGTVNETALPAGAGTGTGAGESGRGARPGIGPGSVVLLLVAAVSAYGIYAPLIPEAKAASALVLMLALILARVPIGISMLVPGLLGVHAIRGGGAAAGLMSETPFGAAASWSMSVIPLFIFMGTLLWKSGITDDLFRSGELFLGRLPGGLAVATNVAGAGLSAVTGTTIASTYTLARSALPGMLRNGYSPRVAISSVMAAGMPGQLIPPSVLLVVYAGIAEVSVGPQLIAGIVPGLMFTVAFSALFMAYAKITRARGSGEPVPAPAGLWRERLGSLGRAWPIVPIMAAVIGGIYGGWVTATEAAAVASLLSIALTVFRKGKGSLKIIADAAADALISSGAIFLLIFGAKSIALMITVSRLGARMTEWLTGLGFGRVGLLILLLVVFLLLGMFMDTLALILVTVPLLTPVLVQLDVSLIWFGVFITIVGELALLHPPVGILGYLLYDLCRDPEVNLGRRITLTDVFIASAVVVPVAVLIILLLIFFPALGTIGA